MDITNPVTRRNFLATSSAAAVLAGGVKTNAETKPTHTAPERPLRVASINSIFRLRSHAYHICGRVIHGFQYNGAHHQPALKLVRMYDDQTPPDDLGKSWSQRYGIELCDSVAATLGGERGLDVDAVLLIIEHGEYLVNERGQILYPRYELFEQICQVFRKAGRSVPVFVDKHLSYDHRKAAQMMAWSRELKIPMMAGSSLPVTWRWPSLEAPLETRFEEGVVCFGYDRSHVEIYLFHALESLQCFMERRRGSETGVQSVQALTGDAVWKAADQGLFSWKLLEAAIGRCPSANVGPIRDNVLKPLLVLVRYRDGTRGAALNLIEQVSDFGFAGQIAGREEPFSTCLYLPAPPGARFFDPLTYNIEQFFLTGQPTYPAERTQLTSTMLDLALHSLHDGSRVIESPALDIRYQAPAFSGYFQGPINDRP